MWGGGQFSEKGSGEASEKVTFEHMSACSKGMNPAYNARKRGVDRILTIYSLRRKSAQSRNKMPGVATARGEL